MRPYLKFTAVFALLAGCGEGPLEPGPFALDGTWLGRGFPYELALELRQDGDNVTGDGQIRSLRELLETDTTSLDPLVIDTLVIDTLVVNAVDVTVEGDWGYPDFVLRLRAPDYADAVYAGQFGRTSPDSVTGTLRESGFDGAAVRIVRQTDADE